MRVQVLCRTPFSGGALTAKLTRKELRVLELTQAWSNGLSRAKVRALPGDLRQSDLESLPSLQTQAAFSVEAGLAGIGLRFVPVRASLPHPKDCVRWLEKCSTRTRLLFTPCIRHFSPFTRTFIKRCIQFLHRAAAQQPQRVLNIAAQNLDCAFYARFDSRRRLRARRPRSNLGIEPRPG